MNDNAASPASRKDRYGVTRRTHISVTHLAYDQIQAWADQQGISFSAAIESLALMGLGQETAELLPLLIRGLLERLLAQQFNRFAKLLSLAALSAEEANSKIDTLVLNLIRQEAAADPARFVSNMSVSSDPQNQTAVQIRQLREEIKRNAQSAALKRLKRKLPPAEKMMTQTETEDEAERDV
ncbi:MAG: hypothetical protein H6656_00055 [Ardenticatenaceae bacterium]|nr:hypothetical protein [Anaerolineales bacterium]MCB9005777.1 hypothetical protein [Ardenticatenaceae bacterium]